jgi:two-component system osmolarity sensor histidine kinase EnvZ
LEVQIGKELIKRLGQNTIIASKVNGNNGLWVGFQIEKDSYWLLMDPGRLNPVAASTWLVWLLIAIAVTLHLLAVLQRGGLPLARSIASPSLRPGDQPSHWPAQILRSIRGGR